MSFLRKLLVWAFVLGLLALVAAGGAGWWAWQKLHEPFAAYGDEVVVDIASGTSATAILQLLQAKGVIFDARLARLFLIHRLEDPALKAGEYRFTEPASTPEVLDKLVRGQVLTYPLTLIEGLTIDEAAASIARSEFGDEEILRREMDRAELITDLDPEATNLEGYLYPETYHFAAGTTEREIVETLVRTFRRKLEKEVTPVFAERDDLSLRQLVVLASIIEKETQLDEERGLVSSVYNNRLRIGMGLYADPTIIYAKKLDGTWDGNLRRPDLKLDSPYNTYVYPGLPPGPICSPSAASLVAAAVPAETKYLYFVSRNDGTHVFAETKREHDANVYRWQKLYWRQRWAKERAEKAEKGARK